MALVFKIFAFTFRSVSSFPFPLSGMLISDTRTPDSDADVGIHREKEKWETKGGGDFRCVGTRMQTEELTAGSRLDDLG